MPPKVQGTSLSTEQVQLLCQVVQFSESPKKESWEAIAHKLNITNGGAAQQRFGRLLKALKATDPTSSPGRGAPKTKPASKKAIPGKANGKGSRKPKHAEEEEDENEDEDQQSDEVETPTKKRKTEKEPGAGKWKSLFGGDDDAVKIEEDDDNVDEEVVS